jgi:pimeloyl-ACP methyl ester carboxylesterase
MQRRDLLGAGMAAAMLSAPSNSQDTAGSNPQRAVVLVHGANHGGWCWVHVATRLRAMGYRVLTPTLTGLADRRHLRSPEISLATHIDDIANLIEWEELDAIILVAHSYGGTVVTGVCDRLRQCIARVIFIDANTPQDGQATIPGLTVELAEKITGAPLLDGYLLPPLDPIRMGIDPDDTDNIEWLNRRLTAHPLQTLTEPIKLANGGSDGMHRTFVLATPLEQLQKFAADGTLKIKADPSWRFREFLVGHDVMIIAPDETADLIHEIAIDDA